MDNENGNTTQNNGRNSVSPSLEMFVIDEDLATVMLQSHFRNYCTQPSSRSLNMEQFELLMTHFAAVTDMDPPSETELQNFMQAMDTDGNGKLEEDEWVGFMMKGFSLDDKAAAAFAQRSQMHMKCIAAIQLSKAQVFQRSKIVRSVFKKYDTDGNGSIDATEMRDMIADVISERSDPPSEKEIKLFMGAMSNSEDGKVHEKDVLKFFLGGAAQSYERRRNFASRSPMHAKLDHFIQYILDVEISNY